MPKETYCYIARLLTVSVCNCRLMLGLLGDGRAVS